MTFSQAIRQNADIKQKDWSDDSIVTGSYADDTPAEYSSIVDEVTKDQEVKTLKFETKN
mgnify:CR=1 FL=1